MEELHGEIYKGCLQMTSFKQLRRENKKIFIFENWIGDQNLDKSKRSKQICVVCKLILR